MIKITGLKIPISYDMKMLQDIAVKRLGIEHSRIKSINILKRTVNTDNKEDIYFDMVIGICVFGDDEDQVISLNRDKRISKETKLYYTLPKIKKFNERPIVVGCGPAGLFAALILAQAGARPLLLERGTDVDSRRQKVLKFWQDGILDTRTNIQFGEGGAGTFSDGKLKIGFKNVRKVKVLNELVEAGAPSEIMYLGKPHIGTDFLHKTVKAIREKIISLGGEVRFNSLVTEVKLDNGKVMGVGLTENGNNIEIPADYVVLAIGHSARDTFESLHNSGVHIEQKPFAVGVRIEHSQEMINKIQYGDFAGHPALGAADYKMVVHLPNGRSVYTFCMCPGGTVVAAASEEKRLLTNGMSEFNRDCRNSNSALLVSVDKKDLRSDYPLAGVEFQRRIEEAAFLAGGGGYKAPVQRLESFLNKRRTMELGDVLPTYLPGTSLSEVDSYLPDYITDSLREGIKEMGLWMSGFAYPDAVLTGCETRSSSPIKITRDENMEAVGIKGLYPCGEGAGYTGGIISAAVDGIICAERILGSHYEEGNL